MDSRAGKISTIYICVIHIIYRLDIVVIGSCYCRPMRMTNNLIFIINN